MKSKSIIIILILILLVGMGYISFKKKQKLTENSKIILDQKRQDCINMYGTKEDPLGLSDNSDPRLVECLKQVDPSNPLGI